MEVGQSGAEARSMRSHKGEINASTKKTTF